MILTAHQPCYLPWLGLFAKIALADTFCIFDAVQFERHGYSNRVKIKTNTGPQWLTVPVEHGMPLLKDAKIVQGGWARKHCRTIELAYQKAPFFPLYFDALREILMREHNLLVELDTALLRFLLNALGIRTKIVKASEQDFRGSKSELVLDMCRKLGAKAYIFGQYGASYADVPAFDRAGVGVLFQSYQHPTYPQLHGAFESGLSIIDLLFNHGPESLTILTNGRLERVRAELRDGTYERLAKTEVQA